MKKAFAHVLCAAALLLGAASASLPVDAKTVRSAAERAAFVRANPCPATGLRRGKCPGWEVDHIIALCAGGADARENMQWLTVQDHRQKTRIDRRICRKRA